MDRDAGAMAPAGLKGLVVAETGVGDVRGEEGFYHYREYSAIELATTRSLADVWFLMFSGHLPDHTERADFAARVAERRQLPDGMAPVLRAILGGDRTAAPLDLLRAATAAAGAMRGLRPLIDLTEAQRLDDAITMAAVVPTLVGALHRLAQGMQPLDARDDLGDAANYLWMLNGEEPSPTSVDAINAYLVSTIDHGFNASTFTGRVVASTGADLGACVVAAMAALSGPLHGGAPSRALDLLDEIGDASRIDAVLRSHLRAGERLMGFGHAVYRGDDPRSLMLRDIAISMGGPLVDLAVEVERRALEVLAEERPGRPLRTNVEFYAGVVMHECGIPRELFTSTFATSRVIGWCANILEQARDRHIIRPIARYTGPAAPQPVPAR